MLLVDVIRARKFLAVSKSRGPAFPRTMSSLRLRHTWDSPRLVELAAIAIAGLALFAVLAGTRFAMSLFVQIADYFGRCRTAHVRGQVAGRLCRIDFD